MASTAADELIGDTGVICDSAVSGDADDCQSTIGQPMQQQQQNKSGSTDTTTDCNCNLTQLASSSQT